MLLSLCASFFFMRGGREGGREGGKGGALKHFTFGLCERKNESEGQNLESCTNVAHVLEICELVKRTYSVARTL